MSDRWAEWLQGRRDGGSAEQRRATLERLAPVRDRILDAVALTPGEVLLDVGCGDGLVGLAALDRGARVIFADISRDCLDACRATAGDAAQYVQASATDLGELRADVVTTRSVLIYVQEKQRVFDEFFRVLRPGGRISLFEPINRFGLEERRGTYGFRDVESVADLLARVVAEISGEDGTGTPDAMTGFDERDLLEHARTAGFVDLRLDYRAELTSDAWWETRDWTTFVNMSPNPLAPTFGEAMAVALTRDEAERLATVLRPRVEDGIGATCLAGAFLVARKP